MKQLQSLSYFDPSTKSLGLRRLGSAIHRRYAVLLGILFFSTALLAASQGGVKSWAEIDWLDVAAEGLVVLAALSWMAFSLSWRPPGPVSHWLLSGFALLAYGFYLDALDEFIRLDATLLGGQLESVVTPMSVLIISYGIFSLSQEQRVLGRQLRGREGDYRDHRDIDPVTDLYNGRYCRAALAGAVEKGRAFSLCLIDLQDFDAINRQFGFAVGDSVLNCVARTLVATAPTESLVCRYGGDRFAIINSQTQTCSELTQILDLLLSEAVKLALFQQTGTQARLAVRGSIVQLESGEGLSSMLLRAESGLCKRGAG